MPSLRHLVSTLAALLTPARAGERLPQAVLVPVRLVSDPRAARVRGDGHSR